MSVKKKSVLRNSAWNYLSFIFGIIVLLVTVPIYIRCLGLDQFGIYTLLVAITSPLKIMRAGIPEATTKYIAEFENKGEYKKCANIASTMLFFNVLIGIVGILLVFLLSNWLVTSFFNISNNLRLEAIYAFRLTAVLWFLTQLGNTFKSVVRGLQDYQSISIGTIYQQLVQATGGVILVSFYPYLSYLIFFNCIVVIFFIFYWFILAKRAIPNIRFIPKVDRFSFKKTISFSFWLIIQSLFGISAGVADRVIIGAFFTSSILGIYSIAQKIYQKAYNSSTVIINTLLPAISSVSHIYLEGEKQILNYSWKISIVCGWFIASGFVLGPDLLSIWVGKEIGVVAGPLLRVLLITVLIEIPSIMMVQYLYANALPKWTTIVNIITASSTILLMVILVEEYKMLGVVWGGFIGIVLTRIPFHLLWVFPKKFKNHFSFYYYLHSLYGILFSVCVGGFAGVVLHELFIKNFDNPFGLLLSIFLSPFVILLFLLATESFIFRKKKKVIELIRDAQKRIFYYPKRFWKLNV